MTNAAGTLLLFWDYDTQWGADRSRAPGGPKPWGRLDFEHTDALLEIHERYRIPACFAAVGAAAMPGERPYHDPRQLRRIHAAGHEIASHSLRHEWLPGLDARELFEVVRTSRDALEQCIGDRVIAFVPPFNQPFDYLRGLSFSLAERREAGRRRTDLARLCASLREAGYRLCRVAYRPLFRRVAERLAGRRLDRPGPLANIAGLLCARLNTPCGFREDARAVLECSAGRGGVVVAYGHPHSIHSGNSQDLRHLVPFLEAAAELRRAGRLRIATPRDLVGEVAL